MQVNDISFALVMLIVGVNTGQRTTKTTSHLTPSQPGLDRYYNLYSGAYKRIRSSANVSTAKHKMQMRRSMVFYGQRYQNQYSWAGRQTIEMGAHSAVPDFNVVT